KSNCLLIFINQIREKIGIVYGNPNTTTGGNALKFYASQRLEVKKVATESTGGEATSNRVKVKVVKNKTAPPFKEAEFSIEFGVGIDKLGEIIDLAVDNNIVKKSGAWYSYEGTQIGQGISKVKEIMNDNP